jgi:hypothetical protein
MSQTLVDIDNTENMTLAHEKQVQFQNESIQCSNCGADLTGKYCHQCGQSSRSMIKFFGEVVKELLDDLVGYDSRLKHSVIPLFFQPGRITQEYIRGRRFHYVLPFRLYLFTSLFFILTLQFNTDASKLVFSPLSKDEITKERIINSSEISAPVVVAKSANKTMQNNSLAGQEKNYGIQWDDKNSKFISLNLGEGFIKDAVDEVNSKIKGWREDPKPLIDELFQLLPYMMFMLLPIFAIVLKLFYLFSKKYYVEHLVFLLHNHSFLYAAILTQFLLGFIETSFINSEFWLAQIILTIAEVASVLLMIWMFLYVVFATKNVYQQSWFMTISKLTLLGMVYFTMLSVALVVTFAIGAYIA